MPGPMEHGRGGGKQKWGTQEGLVAPRGAMGTMRWWTPGIHGPPGVHGPQESTCTLMLTGTQDPKGI